MGTSKNDRVNLQETREFCAARGFRPGMRYQAEIRGRVRTCVFSRIGGTGWMICHEEGEPDMQSSWGCSPDSFLKDYNSAKN